MFYFVSHRRRRPVRTSSGAAPLAACGSVFHHCVVYVRQGGTLHALDYAPANGSDVTANLLEEFPSREVRPGTPCGCFPACSSAVHGVS